MASHPIIKKSSDHIAKIQVAGNIIKHIFSTLPEILKPGINTKEIDLHVCQAIAKEGGSPAFFGYNGYPASCCVSINEEIIHGIPNEKKIILENDLVSVDIGVAYYEGIADSAYTFYVGDTIPDDVSMLMKTTKEALLSGVKAVKPGARISDISKAVYAHAQKENLGVIRDYCGHGVGEKIHEAPEIPNYYPFLGNNPRLQEGMVIAIEPMFTLGGDAITHASDNFTVVSLDNSLAAHYEHTVAVTKDGYKILT